MHTRSLRPPTSCLLPAGDENMKATLSLRTRVPRENRKTENSKIQNSNFQNSRAAKQPPEPSIEVGGAARTPATPPSSSLAVLLRTVTAAVRTAFPLTARLDMSTCIIIHGPPGVLLYVLEGKSRRDQPEARNMDRGKRLTTTSPQT